MSVPVRETPARSDALPQVTEREARAVAEAAREREWVRPSFVRELFLGRLRLDLIHPFPASDAEADARSDAFFARLGDFLREEVDGGEIERRGNVPQPVLNGLKELGAFGIKIPPEYGGLGLSQRGYGRAIALVSSVSPALAVLLSAHQSIGVPQPLKMFGTEEQKKKYLPRLAKGAVSAFALTEPDVGSDPARMSATAEPTEDGSAFVLNGEKLWCTNGPIADLLVVMARTPAANGKRPGITAFIVEGSAPGLELVHRCGFMGLRGIENGVLRLDNVRVPREDILWKEGGGLKLALITLNTGRLTIPATCAAAGKWCLRVSREWAATRKQWGAPIGKHEAIGHKLANMAADTFAMEAVAELAAALADSGGYDIRLEAAMAKMLNSEAAWRIADDTVQIRGGRGYETADSLEARGEAPIPVEQVLRDLRINLIFEGSSEVMRLFIAREAVDPHLQRAGSLVDPDAPARAKVRGMVGLGTHMTRWFAGNTIRWGHLSRYGEFGALTGHLRYAERTAHKLARTLAYAMARYGPGLEKRQVVLFRLVDIGAQLFAMAATCAYARKQLEEKPQDANAATLADLFCRGARQRIDTAFSSVLRNDDAFTYRVAGEVLKGEYGWLEQDIIAPPAPEATA